MEEELNIGEFSDEDECLDAFGETVECDTDLMVDIMRVANLELKRQKATGLGHSNNQIHTNCDACKDGMIQKILIDQVLRKLVKALEYSRSEDFK